MDRVPKATAISAEKIESTLRSYSRKIASFSGLRHRHRLAERVEYLLAVRCDWE